MSEHHKIEITVTPFRQVDLETTQAKLAFNVMLLRPDDGGMVQFDLAPSGDLAIGDRMKNFFGSSSYTLREARVHSGVANALQTFLLRQVGAANVEYLTPLVKKMSESLYLPSNEELKEFQDACMGYLTHLIDRNTVFFTQPGGANLSSAVSFRIPPSDLAKLQNAAIEDFQIPYVDLSDCKGLLITKAKSRSEGPNDKRYVMQDDFIAFTIADLSKLSGVVKPEGVTFKVTIVNILDLFGYSVEIQLPDGRFDRVIIRLPVRTMDYPAAIHHGEVEELGRLLNKPTGNSNVVIAPFINLCWTISKNPGCWMVADEVMISLSETIAARLNARFEVNQYVHGKSTLYRHIVPSENVPVVGGSGNDIIVTGHFQDGKIRLSFKHASKPAAFRISADIDTALAENQVQSREECREHLRKYGDKIAKLHAAQLEYWLATYCDHAPRNGPRELLKTIRAVIDLEFVILNDDASDDFEIIAEEGRTLEPRDKIGKDLDIILKEYQIYARWTIFNLYQEHKFEQDHAAGNN